MAVLKNRRISCKAGSPLHKSGFSHGRLVCPCADGTVQIDASIFFTSLPATALRPRPSPATGRFKELTPRRPRSEPRCTSWPATATSSLDRTTLCQASWEGTILKVPGASAGMSGGPSFLPLALCPALPALAPAMSPRLPSAPQPGPAGRSLSRGFCLPASPSRHSISEWRMQSIARDSDESSDDEFFDAHGRRALGAHGGASPGEVAGLKELGR